MVHLLTSDRNLDFMPSFAYAIEERFKSFGDLLAKFRGFHFLRVVRIGIPHGSIVMFRQQMSQTALAAFPNVRCLTVPLPSSCVIRHCPQLSTLHIIATGVANYDNRECQKAARERKVFHNQVMAMIDDLKKGPKDPGNIKTLELETIRGVCDVSFLRGEHNAFDT